METNKKSMITVEVIVDVPMDIVWEYWNEPEHIKNWYYASEDWHTPYASNDFKIGGVFVYRMEAKDGSFGFDYSGIYTEIEQSELISYELEDGRKVNIYFRQSGSGTKITESFDAEEENSEELQKNGWLAILNNFKKYTELNNTN